MGYDRLVAGWSHLAGRPVAAAKLAAKPEARPLVLSDGERESLQALARMRTASQSLALRARIVLACAEELSQHLRAGT